MDLLNLSRVLRQLGTSSCTRPFILADWQGRPGVTSACETQTIAVTMPRVMDHASRSRRALRFAVGSMLLGGSMVAEGCNSGPPPHVNPGPTNQPEPVHVNEGPKPESDSPPPDGHPPDHVNPGPEPEPEAGPDPVDVNPGPQEEAAPETSKVNPGPHGETAPDGKPTAKHVNPGPQDDPAKRK